MTPIRVLFADDQAAELAPGQFTKVLRSHGIDIETETIASNITGRLKAGFDLLLLDLNFDQPRKQSLQGEDVLAKVKEEFPALPVVILTQIDSASNLHKLIDQGAFDYLPKETRLDLDRIARTIQRAVERARLEQQVLLLKEHMNSGLETELAGGSPAIEAVRQKIREASAVDSTVLILGETGTGKELVARAVHRNSRRRDNPFVARNCGALTETLLESELFGHVKGAFTSAERDKKGDFELASGGTILLDEVGEAPAKVQTDLLRVLQERCIRLVGGTADREIDVRVIAATNRDLQKEIRERKFRQDLYYRLNVIEIRVPPLRDRLEDLDLLCQALIGKLRARRIPIDGITREAVAKLRRHDWPGNVRELENLLERAAAQVQYAGRTNLEPGDFLLGVDAAAASALLSDLDASADALLAGTTTFETVLEGMQSLALRELLLRLMERMKEKNHRTPTQEELAAVLGMNRTALAQMIKRKDLPGYAELRRMANG